MKRRETSVGRLMSGRPRCKPHQMREKCQLVALFAFSTTQPQGIPIFNDVTSSEFRQLVLVIRHLIGSADYFHWYPNQKGGGAI